jgi:hypothetical protein
MDSICNMLQSWNSSSELGSAERPKRFPALASPPPASSVLTADELALLKKQEAEGKILIHQAPFTTPPDISTSTTSTETISFTIPNQQSTNPHGFVCITTPEITTQQPKTQIHNPNSTLPNQTTLDNHRDHNPNFSLSIARPKSDFPHFHGEDPINWLRQCEKYFTLVNVPMETWVPLATLHCNGAAQTWWHSLRTPTNYVHWTQFCNMLSNRFSPP